MITTKRWMAAMLMVLALATSSSEALANGGHFSFSLTPPNHHYDHAYSYYGYPSYYYGHNNRGYRGQYGYGVRQHGYWRYGQKHRYRARH